MMRGVSQSMRLKKYQKASLDTLKIYLETSRFQGAKQAYDVVQTQRYGGEPFKPYQPLFMDSRLRGNDGEVRGNDDAKTLNDVPYVCLRLPTGGGKTLLSAHTIRLAGEHYLENEYPLTLWLVPTNTIKLQTLETLKNPDHANRRVLDDCFDGKFRVFDISDFRQIRPQDIAGSACVIVSTFAALRVEDTEGRKVYAHDENLEVHFSKVPEHLEGMERDKASEQIKYSFANLLRWHRPLVIVDEAHNAKSELSVDVLNRIHAACVVEYTATPAKNSNIIHSVSAAELKAEDMIKLPIIFSEHASWEQAVIASIQSRQKLEDIAVKDKDYIRPIVLFQAENKGQDTTVEVLEKYLVENEGIDRKQIAIATGTQRELDDIDLFDVNCPIRYVITVQALKEGWDCSFAYVLCSVANTRSKTAVEQLLGRVLRMPYAKRRAQEELNKAYAHVSSKSWPHAVSLLHDRLVNMGFEKQEAEEFIYTQPSLDLEAPQAEPFEVQLSAEPDLSSLDLLEQGCVRVEEVEEGFSLKIAGDFTAALVTKLAKAAKNKKDKVEISLKGKIHIQHQQANLTPSQRGEVFSVPQLCLQFDDGVELAEVEICLDEQGWSLLDYSTVFDCNAFSVDEQADQYIADIAGEKIKISLLGQAEQLQLTGIKTDMTELDLCCWLDKRLHQADIKQEILLEFLRRVVQKLVTREDLDMPALVRGKFILEKVLRDRISKYRKEAFNKGYQTCMFGPKAIATVEPSEFSFSFEPDNYPANVLYEGAIAFDKHYYPRIAGMNNEEVECARAIDRNPLVQTWVRNLERQTIHAFWLPTSTDKFYPDFVVKLNDGRFLVIEYKGAHLKNDDSAEKELIGKVWAEKSGNLFLMAWEEHESRDVQQQINDVLANG